MKFQSKKHQKHIFGCNCPCHHCYTCVRSLIHPWPYVIFLSYTVFLCIHVHGHWYDNCNIIYPAQVIPGLLVVLDDTANPRVQAHAAAALVNFSDDCPKTILATYLDNILAKLEAVLASKLREVGVVITNIEKVVQGTLNAMLDVPRAND